jgi:hypothetical protein
VTSDFPEYRRLSPIQLTTIKSLKMCPDKKLTGVARPAARDLQAMGLLDDGFNVTEAGWYCYKLGVIPRRLDKRANGEQTTTRDATPIDRPVAAK